MSLPEFPTISPALTREDAINQIISSIAMEELALSHIINAEGEKIQYILGTLPGTTGPQPTIEQVLEINESVRAVLESTAEVQSGLRSKLQSVLTSSGRGATGATGPTGPTGPSGVTGGLNAFGSIFDNSADTIQYQSNVAQAITLSESTVEKNVSYEPENSITVAEEGIYYISYYASPTFTSTGSVEAAVRMNGVNIPVTVFSYPTTAGGSLTYRGDAIYSMPAGAVVDIAITVGTAQAVTFNSTTTRYLNIFRLD